MTRVRFPKLEQFMTFRRGFSSTVLRIALLLFAVAISAIGVTSVAQQPKPPAEKDGALEAPRILAAGTTTANIEKSVRVKLKNDVSKQLGEHAIVLLTTRAPVDGLPVFVPFWKSARDGFDITLGDTTLPANTTRIYLGTKNREFTVDWIVVKK
jgi:hypothetical protein